LLDFAKLESGKTEVRETEFFAASVVDEVLEIMMSVARKKDLTLAEEIDETLACKPLIGDVHLIKQCLLNLVHNAVKFTPKGSIKVRVQSVGANADSLTLKFCVTDDGIGLAESKKAALFQPFVQGDGSTTRKYGGTGLGLAISSGYVALMQGQIGFTSEEHKGSTFWFSVPLKVGQTC
jgi:two-component system, sensor histidine kinase and response regulator